MQYGFWSVVPPILTIVLALVTKNVFFSLLIGIFTSSMVLCGGSPLTGLNDAFYSFIHTLRAVGIRSPSFPSCSSAHSYTL